MPPLPAQLIFGRYELQERLAAGGMGEVFLARQVGAPGFERRAILKSLLPAVVRQPGAVEQFLDEARIAATLNHPNVVSIYEIGQWEGTYYLAMEYIDGDTLSGLRRAAASMGQALPVAVSVKVAHDAALGLAHAHRAVDLSGNPMEIVHRDISPQNIMVRRDGVTKVVDFGIALAARRATRTLAGYIKGKLAYLPPEYVGGASIDARGDQYSLGAVLWELLVGRRLFERVSEGELVRRVIQGVTERPSELVPDIPAELDAIVMRMLVLEPRDRFADCQAVAEELGRWLEREAPGMEAMVVAKTVGPLIDLRRPEGRMRPLDPPAPADAEAALPRLSLAPTLPARPPLQTSSATPPAEPVPPAEPGGHPRAVRIAAAGVALSVLGVLVVAVLMPERASAPPVRPVPASPLEPVPPAPITPAPITPAPVAPALGAVAPSPPDRMKALAPLAKSKFGGLRVPGLRCEGVPSDPAVQSLEQRAALATSDSRFTEAIELGDEAIRSEPEAGHLYSELALAAQSAVSPAHGDRILLDLESFRAACPATDVRLVQEVLGRLSGEPSELEGVDRYRAMAGLAFGGGLDAGAMVAAALALTGRSPRTASARSAWATSTPAAVASDRADPHSADNRAVEGHRFRRSFRCVGASTSLGMPTTIDACWATCARLTGRGCSFRDGTQGVLECRRCDQHQPVKAGGVDFWGADMP